MSTFTRAAALAAGLMLGTAASAQDGTFVVTNDSDYTMTGFQTGERSGWSRDWIARDAILPGEQFEMRFTAGEGACVVPTLVTFEDGATFNVDVDYCSTGHLILTNTTISGE